MSKGYGFYILPMCAFIKDIDGKIEIKFGWLNRVITLTYGGNNE